MMRLPKLCVFISAWAFAALRVCCCDAQGLDYWIALDRETDLPSLAVTLRYAGGPAGADRLTLPARFTGDRQSLRDFRLRVRGGAWRYTPDSMAIDIAYPPGDTVTLSYRVAAHQPFLTTGITLTPSLFVAPGFAFLAAPQWEQYRPRIRFAESDYRAVLPDAHYPDLRWLETLCTGGGAYRYVQRGLLELWIAGDEWPFADTELLEMLYMADQAQQQLWRVSTPTPLSLALTPLPPPPVMAQGGTAATLGPSGIQLGDGLSCFAHPQSLSGAGDLEHLLHHETTHRYIGGNIREGADAGSRHWAWLTEGFTEYMALQSRIVAGSLRPKEYAALLNDAYLRPYYLSPLANVENTRIAAHYAEPAYAEIAYLRGCILAFYLDMRMQKRNGMRLADVMTATARAFGEQGKSLERDFDFFSKKISAALGTDFAPIYQKHILRGEPIRDFVTPAGMSLRFESDGVPVLSIREE